MPEVLARNSLSRFRPRGELIGGKTAAPELCAFVARILGKPADTFENANAIGLVRGGRIVVAVVYNQFHWPDIAMHVAAAPGAMWATPSFLYHAFAYPFVQLQCRRVTGLVSSKNDASRRLCQRLGFSLEGTVRDGLPEGDLLIYGLLRSECRYVGQEQKEAA